MRTLLRAYRSDADDREINLIFDGPVTVTGNVDNDCYVLPISVGPVALPWFVPAFLEMRGDDRVVLRGESIALLPARIVLHNPTRWLDAGGEGFPEAFLADVESET
jgi:hypothetical protein